MEDSKVLKLVYTFFVGVLLAIFVGVGIDTFYTGPKAPEYPTELSSPSVKEPTPEQTDKQREYDMKIAQYNKDMQPYNRNVSIISLSAAVVLLALSIAFEKRIKLIADGVMLGGLFTLIYSIGRSFASENSKYVFVVVSAGLAIVLYLGFHRFVRPQVAVAAVKSKGKRK